MAVTVDHLYSSPLRYPGGKRKLANFVKLLFLKNHLVGSEYVEPYALSLLFEEYASHVHINDLNRSIHAFWRVVLDRPNELCERIVSARLDLPEWQRQKEVQEQPSPDQLDLAFSTFYLNRTCRSGIIGGGPIGGHEQRGTWRIDARFNKEDLIRRIKRIARFRRRITLTGHDASHYLREVLPGILDRPILAYLDPPYFVKGAKRAGLYQNFYQPDDHAEIAELVSQLEVPWIVSYDDVPQVEVLYGRYRSISYDLNYSAQLKHFGSERMFFSPDIEPPDVASPAHVPVSAVDQECAVA
jgi:DNA adenine methylase